MLAYKEIHYKKKASKGIWRPRYRWLVSFTIKLDKPNKTTHQYYTPKSTEEERKLEEDFNEKMDRVFELIFPEGIHKALEDFRKENKNNKIQKPMELNLLPIKPFQETLHKSMCGPASLKMVFDYYGYDKSEKDIAEMCSTTDELGTTAEGIQKATQMLGLKARIKDNSTFEDIQYWLDRKVPVIVNWFTRGRIDYPEEDVPDGHYSVVVGLDNEFIYLQDPEIGKLRKVTRDDFMKVWFDFKGKYIEPNEVIVRQLIAIYK